jgi:hypothetical protein
VFDERGQDAACRGDGESGVERLGGEFGPFFGRAGGDWYINDLEEGSRRRFDGVYVLGVTMSHHLTVGVSTFSPAPM